MLDEAAKVEPDLVVLPEFCNHLSWYESKDHCFEVAVSLDGPFLRAIADKAAALNAYVAVNCTVRRENGTATGSGLLYSPDGKLLLDNTKQIYIGHENDFLEKASTPGEVIDTPLGRVGLYACMDGVINETPRCLALGGAQLMLNSLNSFASDEGSLHIPVRAAENKVYVIAANKIGPLVPEHMVDGIAAATGIPIRFLNGAGESQIVAPDGEVLAKASLDREEVVFADIDVTRANDKTRPDGTDIVTSRRPELYKAIASDPATQILPPMQGAESTQAVIISAPLDSDCAADELRRAVAAGAELVVFPPLFDANRNSAENAQALAGAVGELSALLGSAIAVSAGAVRRAEGEGEGEQYCAIAFTSDGIVLTQPQMHFSKRHHWSTLADEVALYEAPFGRMALVTSDDTIYPEHFRLLGMAGVEVAAVPLQPLEKWELHTGLLERSAENRIGLLVAALPSSLGTSFGTSLQSEFTLMTPWEERPFDGLLSQPEVTRARHDQIAMTVTLHPANAANKVVSQNTDLLTDRPWELSGAIASR